MFRCIVQMYGLPQDVTELREVEIELNDNACLKDVVIALKSKIPSLEGPIIRTGEDALVEYHKFNVNGHFYSENLNIQIKPGDNVALLIPVYGG